MMLNGKGGRMTVRELSRQMFEDYLKDCGLDPLFWDCAGAADLLLCWLAAHDFGILRRFADLPVEVRSRIVSATGLCTGWARMSSTASCFKAVSDE